MGRYYSGNIDGKFWFGIQDSTDGEFFGMQESINAIDYYTEDLDTAEKGIKSCKEELGDNLDRLESFFSKNNSYNDGMIVNKWLDKYGEEINIEDIKTMLTWYARHELGTKIVNAIKEDGYCSFEAEI